MFESRISAGATEKPLCSGKPDADISLWSYDMEGQCKEMRGAILRAGEQNTAATVHSNNSMPYHQFKEEENGICWRIVKSLMPV